jgi:hypothetical protein
MSRIARESLVYMVLDAVELVSVLLLVAAKAHFLLFVHTLNFFTNFVDNCYGSYDLCGRPISVFVYFKPETNF